MPMFSKKHYIVIGAAIRQVNAEAIRDDVFDTGAIICKSEIIDALAELFERDNPEFNEALFRSDCEV